ncbi:MAG TPA: DedA family protein [Longimicrobiales bacterium]
MEDFLLHDIIPLLIAVGPWIVFLVALGETAAFIGLLLPAEAIVLVAGFLAERGVFAVEEILGSAILGGFAGDQAGYLLGRHGGGRIVMRPGRIGRLWQRHQEMAGEMFRRHSALAVTIARLFSFVRTFMPWFAGMSRMSYPRFVVFDLLGVVVWAGGSVALGYLAGESWHLVAGMLGTAGALALAVVVAGVAIVGLRRRRAPAGE